MKRVNQLLTYRRTFNFYNAPSKHTVSTLSPLATAFNTRPVPQYKFGVQNFIGLFGIEELKTHEGFYVLKDKVTEDTSRLMEESVSPNRSRKIVEVFDELSDTLCRVADLAEFVRIAHPHNNFSLAAEDACIYISGIVEKLNTNPAMYLALKEAVLKGDKILTSEVDNHVASLFLFDFEQCGIHLPETERKEVVTLNDYILQLGQRFMAGALSSRSVPKNTVSENIRQFFQSDKDQIIVSGLFSDSKLESVRETAYKIYLMSDPNQQHLLNELLSSRYKLALLCGFPTYAHRALKSSLAGSPEQVKLFLEETSELIAPMAEKDFKYMTNMKKECDPNSGPLAAWDIPHLTNKVKTEWLKTHNLEYSPYFSLGSCMDGLNNLMNQLFGITFVNTPISPGEVWAQDIYKLAVTHESEGLLGYIYCDFFERSNKPNQDCHFTIRGGRRLSNGSYQDPLVVVMLNLPTPRWSGPSLLTPGMVDNLFHEMGHAMHSMLARTEHQHVTGTRCTTDFAEVPSVLMEYFASDPRVLRTFAKHYATLEPMPEDMLKQLCSSKHLFAASEMQVQVFYSMLDQMYHGEPLQGSTTEVLEKTQKKFSGIPYVPNTSWELRFSHLVGYGAKYYSYLMSKAIASRIWQTYFVDDPMSRTQGERYRRECLAHGGGKPPRQLVTDFLGRKPTPSLLAQALLNDIKSNT